MKPLMRAFMISFVLAHLCLAQVGQPGRAITNPRFNDDAGRRSAAFNTSRSGGGGDSTVSFYKRKADWQSIIDAYWGPGDPYAQKLAAFDAFASFARSNFPAFGYTGLNWDSVAAYWRSRITDSTSRGGFSAILSNLAFRLNDWHAWAADIQVIETPPTIRTPVVAVPWFTRDVRRFGAALTLLADTTLLVYKVVPNHPLGLEPGDLVLGYEGVPWTRLVDELIEGGVATDVQLGGCPSATFYHRMVWAGLSWHLFDTIDVAKHTTGEVVHLPTAPLATLDVSEPLLQCDQLPVPGIPMPSEDLLAGDVTFGIVQGTNVGYICVRHSADPKISRQFDEAVEALAGTDGLIIDLRMARGGLYGLERGIARLVDFGTTTLLSRRRASSSDLHSLETVATLNFSIPEDDSTLYDRPIAVLVGPQSSSRGDLSPWQLSYVSNVRFFGKSPMGAFSGNWWSNGPTVAGYYLYAPDFIVVDHRFPDVQLWAREFPVDEDVWLTRDGVTRGEDDVVKRAIRWIGTVPHAHDVNVSQPEQVASPAVEGTLYAASDTLYSVDIVTGRATAIGWIGPDPVHGLAIKPSTVPGESRGEMYGVSTTAQNTVVYRVSGSTSVRMASRMTADSIWITAVVENPEAHTLVVSATITDSHGSLVDSVLLSGNHGDTLWSVSIKTPSAQGTYGVSVRTEDLTDGSEYVLERIARFTVSQAAADRTIPIPYMRAIAFDGDGTLFGATLNGRLYRIGPSPADTFYIGTAAGIAYSSLAFHPVTGELWASVRPALAGRDRIYKVDILTGAAVLVGSTGGGRITPAIAFGPVPNSILYGLKSGPVSDTLVTISTDNATATAVGLTGVTGLSALAMLGTSVGVDEPNDLQTPMQFSLAQNYPNPFNPSTTITFELPKSSDVRLNVYDILGREVSVLVNERRDAGVHEVKFDGSKLASGVYFYRLQAGDFGQAKRLVIAK